MLSNDGAKKEWLFVHTADEAHVKSETVLVMPAKRYIFAFTDRPNRELRYLTPGQYVSLWSHNGGNDSFLTDPPNAVLTWVNEQGDVIEQEVIIENASLHETTIVYVISYATNKKPSAKVNLTLRSASLFLDSFHFPSCFPSCKLPKCEKKTISCLGFSCAKVTCCSNWPRYAGGC
jgi:hypothetical protein